MSCVVVVGAGRLLASSRWNPGRPLNITNAQDGPAERRSPAPNAGNVTVEKAQLKAAMLFSIQSLWRSFLAAAPPCESCIIVIVGVTEQ